jgi:hypothetical protein
MTGEHPHPPFHPPWWLANCHVQTCLPFFVRPSAREQGTVRHLVPLDDGDAVVVHDNRPDEWNGGAPVAVLVHGLAGCHGSTYMRRVAACLNCRGVRTFRMDLRGAGAGTAHARRPYHSGRSADAAAVLEAVHSLCPDSALSIIGFSLGGNVVLKLLGEMGGSPPAWLARGAAVSPPVDLLTCEAYIDRPFARQVYVRYFLRQLWRQMEKRRQFVADAVPSEQVPRPRSIRELDETVTAPVWGFTCADDYYRQSSSGPYLARIGVPTLIVSAKDDPLVPYQPLLEAERSDAVTLLLTERGGHVGFIGRANGDPDRYWMDWRIADWITR